MSWLSVLAGAVCGVLSGLGVGGGTLLMVWMTAVCGMEQLQAQGVNLLYFIPTALCALLLHAKNRLIRLKTVLWAALPGCATAALTAWLVHGVDTDLLRRLFGGFLLIVGLTELFGKRKNRLPR